MIGSAKLTNGDIVYRHISPASRKSSSRSLGHIGSTTTQRNYRLSYFRVGTNGVVKDYATGTGLASTTDCTTYLNGLVSSCDSIQPERRNLRDYDQQVRTSGGEPLSAWGRFDRGLGNVVTQ